ncbi:MAG: GtrA family protein [Paludibacter sp.]|jgi:putative flippase GtrA|nr:GtrA family protein [Paludibacter sp.]
MEKFLKNIGLKIQRIIDFFYPPFRKFMPLQLFRYAATGGANLVFDNVLYFVIFHYILQKQMLTVWFVTMSSHIAALIIIFPVTLLSGFLLQKYVTFSASNLKGRIQLARYLGTAIFNLFLIYGGLKLMVDVCGFFPTPSKTFLTVISAILSFVLQKHFSFRIKRS